MTSDSAVIMPGSWADWARQIAEAPGIGKSGQVILQANAFAKEAGLSLESAVAQLLWLGSLAMHNFTYVSWPSGIWHPSSLVISSVERDGVAIDSVTNGFIRMVRELGLDPIQDTVKEGPSGLIARLEQSRNRLRDSKKEKIGVDLESLAKADTSSISPLELENVGNVRGLIYPSGRSLMSYLYDVPFFNTLDELIQHGSLHVRGKVDSHVLTNLNLAVFLPFYQGALANMLGSESVQRNFNLLLRQMLVFWPVEERDIRRPGNIGLALNAVRDRAASGLEALIEIAPPTLSAVEHSAAELPLFEVGVGIRYAGLNRHERLTRIAVGILFWRVASGDFDFQLQRSDYAVADMILHAHETGSRLVEICTSKGKVGIELMKFLVSTGADFDQTDTAVGLSQSSDEKTKTAVLELAVGLQILDVRGSLHESYRLINGDVIGKHLRRWKLKE